MSSRPIATLHSKVRSRLGSISELPSRSKGAGLGLVLALASASPTWASETWSGGGADGNWSTAANWGGAVATAGTLVFGGTTNLVSNNDLFVAGTTLTGIDFAAGAGAFTLTGNAIALNGNLVNQSNQVQTIDLGIAMAAGRTFTTNEAAGGLVVNGVVSGIGKLTLTGNGTLTLGGTNTYSGGTTITNGSITFGSASSASVTQSLAGVLTNTVGNEATITSQLGNSGNASLTFASDSLPVGSAINFVVSGGTNGVSNEIKVTGAAASALLGSSAFFDGTDFAYVDSSGYIRAGVYGTDTGFVNAGSSLTAADNNQVLASITGQGTVSVVTLKFAGSGDVNLTQNAGTTLTLSKGGILRSGGGATTISGGTIASSAAMGFRTDSASDSLTINSVIAAGNQSLTKSGDGTLTLGGANTYTGTTYVDGGTLTITGTQAATSSTNVYAATLNLNNSGALSGGMLTVGNVDAVVNESVANALSGSAKLSVSSGTVNLSQSNNFSGGSSLTGGTIILGQNNSLGTGTVTLQGGTVAGAPNLQATTALTGSNAVSNAITLTGFGVFSGSQSLEMSGVLTVSAASREIDNNISGGVLTLDKVVLSDTTASRQLTLQGSGNTVIASLSDVPGGAATVTQSASRGLVINLAAGSVTLTGSNLTTYSDPTSLEKGTLVLDNAGALGTGTLTITGGTVTADTDLSGANKVMTPVLVQSATTFGGSNNLEFGGNFTFSSTGSKSILATSTGGSILTLSGNIYLSNSTAAQTDTIGGTGNVTISGLISNSSASGAAANGLTLNGPGEVILSNSGNTFSGGLTVAGGTLLLANAGALGTGTLTLSGGTFTAGFDMTGANKLTTPVAFSGGSIGGSNNLEFGGNATFLSTGGKSINITNTGSSPVLLSGNVYLSNSTAAQTDTIGGTGNVTISGLISNSSASGAAANGLTMKGTGELILSNSGNTFSGGLTVAGGTVLLANAGALGTGALTISGGTFTAGYDMTGANKLMTPVSLSGGSLGGSNNLEFGGNVTLLNSGSLSVNVTNTGSSPVTLSGNVFLSNSTVPQTYTLGGAGNLTLSGLISDNTANGTVAMNLDMNGTGELILANGSNTFAGGVTLASGTLLLDAPGAAGTGRLSLNGGTFAAGVDLTGANKVMNPVLVTSASFGGSNAMEFGGDFTVSLFGAHTVTLTGAPVTLSGNVYLSNSTGAQTDTIGGTGNLTVSGLISDSSAGGAAAMGLTMNGSGVLTLANGGNTFSGGVTLASGTLVLDAPGAAGTGRLSLNGGTFAAGVDLTGANKVMNPVLVTSASFGGSNPMEFGGDFTVSLFGAHTVTLIGAPVTLSGNVYLSNSTGVQTDTIGGTGNLTVSGLINDSSQSGAPGINLDLTGSGVITLANGSNPFSGGVTLASGTLVLDAPGAAGTGRLSLNGGTFAAGVDLTGANKVMNPVLVTSASFGGSNPMEFGGDFTVSLFGVHTITLTGAPVTLSGNVYLSNATGAQTDTIGGTGNLTVSGLINDSNQTGAAAMGLTMNGSGVLTLANSGNTFSGGVTLDSGTLAIGADSTSAGGVVTSGPIGTGTLTLAGGTVLAEGGARTISNAVSLIASSAIGGANDLTFAGQVRTPGLNTLTINNTGMTTFAGGIDISLPGSIHFSPSVLTFAGTGNVTINSVISGSGLNDGVVYAGTGITYVSGQNTYSGGTTVDNGATVVLGNSAALGFGGAGLITGTTFVSAGGTLDLNGQVGVNESIDLNGSGVNGAGALINNQAGTTATIGSGVSVIGITNQGSGNQNGTYAVTFTGGGGTGATGVATVSGGIITSVQMTNAGSGYTRNPTVTLTGAGGTGVLNALASGVILGSASVVGGAGNILISGSVSGLDSTDTLTKTGAGTVTLAGANSYSGATIVNQGTLLLTGSLRSAVTVNGGVFGGTGSSTAAITINNGGTLTGGGLGSVGTLTTTRALTLNSGAVDQVDFDPATGHFDQVSAKGVTLSGATLTLNGLGSGEAITAGSSFVIVDNTGTSAISGTFAGLAEGSTISADGYNFTLSYLGGTGNDVALTDTGLSAVPEPSTYALWAGGAALLAVAVRRRKPLQA